MPAQTEAAWSVFGLFVPLGPSLLLFVSATLLPRPWLDIRFFGRVGEQRFAKNELPVLLDRGSVEGTFQKSPAIGEESVFCLLLVQLGGHDAQVVLVLLLLAGELAHE